MERIRRLGRGYAGITATVALALAVGMGGAYAADKIGSKDVATGAVKSKHIKDGQVKTADLAPDAEAASARTADTATTADSATRADIANAVAPNSVSGAGIADGAVGTADIGTDAVTSAKVATNAIGDVQLAPNSVNGSEIVTRGVDENDLNFFSVGGDELELQKPVVSSGVTVAPGTSGTTEVSCPAGGRLVGAGYAWTVKGLNSIITNAPSDTAPNKTWVVEGFVPAGAPANGLFAWANCLDG